MEEQTLMIIVKDPPTGCIKLDDGTENYDFYDCPIDKINELIRADVDSGEIYQNNITIKILIGNKEYDIVSDDFERYGLLKHQIIELSKINKTITQKLFNLPDLKQKIMDKYFYLPPCKILIDGYPKNNNDITIKQTESVSMSCSAAKKALSRRGFYEHKYYIINNEKWISLISNVEGLEAGKTYLLGFMNDYVNETTKSRISTIPVFYNVKVT